MLSNKNFTKSNLTVMQNNQKYSADLYSYESKNKIYDILIFNNQKYFKVNMQISKKTKYHKAIEEYYNI